MTNLDLNRISAADWESAVAFRLFADEDVPTLTVPEQIAARVGERILDGRLLPGERIGEQELADEFQVSRGPVREALRILEREGLATLLARRGAIVTELSAQELTELLDVRAGLFEVAVRRLMAQPCPALMPLMVAGTHRLGALAQDPEATEALLQRYERFGRVLRVAPNRFFLPETVAALAREAAALAEPDGFTAADFNRRTGIGRNVTIEVLEFLDAIGLTRRTGELRHMVGDPGEVLGR